MARGCSDKHNGAGAHLRFNDTATRPATPHDPPSSPIFPSPRFPSPTLPRSSPLSLPALPRLALCPLLLFRLQDLIRQPHPGIDLELLRHFHRRFVPQRTTAHRELLGAGRTGLVWSGVGAFVSVMPEFEAFLQGASADRNRCLYRAKAGSLT
jgi:hypothetical protein